MHGATMNYGIVLMAHQATLHKALCNYVIIRREDHHTLCLGPIMTMGCIPSYVVESMCRYQQGSTHMPCSCQVPCIKALWCGQTHAILSYLESPILPFLLSIFLVQHQVMELCHDSSHLCIRHCVLAPSIYHHVKHQFCC